MSVIPQAQKPEEDEPDPLPLSEPDPLPLSELEDALEDDPEDFELPRFNMTGLLMGRVCAVNELFVGDKLLPIPLWETPKIIQ